MRASHIHSQAFNGPRRQRGMIAMIIAIIVLVSTLLAVIGLLRSVDTSNLIAGTMSFRQGVVQEAENAYAAAKTNIPSGSAANSDSTAVGYYASLQTTGTTRTDLPAALVDTPLGGITMPATSSTGNTVRYIIERLCRAPGVVDKKNCLLPKAIATGGTNDETMGVFAQPRPAAAYRLTVRVDGPKNTLAFVQTIIADQ
ncbi:hypothetical protein [Dokdonella soli]|uniref:Type 4 fimbrial biogenesis protein PilX N-terminal domain-containing protein n=1 Tax=Dokdonella soli TaxID=529810 RepID=A0ABN1ICM9_9GAMM